MPVAKGKSRKRKSNAEVVDEHIQQQQEAMPLTQDGKFVPRFSKRLKTKAGNISDDGGPNDSSDGDTMVPVVDGDNDIVHVHDNDVTTCMHDPPVIDHVESYDAKESNTGDDVIMTGDDVIHNEPMVLPVPTVSQDTSQDKDVDSIKNIILISDQVMHEKDGEVENTSAEAITISDDHCTVLPQYSTDVASTVQHDIAVSDKPHPQLNEYSNIDIDDMESIYLDFEALNDMVTMTTDAVSQLNQEAESNAVALPTVSPQKPDGAESAGNVQVHDNICHSAIRDGSGTVQGLVEELTTLNQFLVNCKKELEAARKQRNIWLRQQSRSK